MDKVDEYDFRDLTGILYLAVNIMVDNQLKIMPMVPKGMQEKMVQSVIAEAQRIYNTLEGRRKLKYEFNIKENPQAWAIKVDGEMIPRR